MTTYSADDAPAILDGLLDTQAAVPLEEPVSVGSIIALAEQVSRARAERDDLLERLRAIRQTVFPHLREQTRRGELARTIEAEADPHPEPEVA